MAEVVILAPLLDGAVAAGEATYMEILADCRVLCKGTATLFSIFYLTGACFLEVYFLIPAISVLIVLLLLIIIVKYKSKGPHTLEATD